MTTDTSTIETTNGTVRGRRDGGVHVFKGMRYADTTAGANRFMPPRPPRTWAGVFDAVNWGASAPQSAVPENTDPFYSWYSAIEPISEDCLFLNVFTPGLGDTTRPVMVWIHGGGWRDFSGTAPGFNGTNLARAQDVVVVTLNHRLSAFGFLQLESSDERFADSGNTGLLDIVMALRWIKDNVAAFGGDPNNVTLFGESGGASKIATILGMPAAKGLFHKAIRQSGSGVLRLCDREEAGQQSARLAQILGCERLDGGELQTLPMETLVSAMKTAGKPFRAMIDGRNFDAHPFDGVASPISAHIPTLSGFTNFETTYHLKLHPKGFDVQYPDVTKRLTRFFGIDSARVEEIISAYREVYPGYKPSEIMVMITSDFVFKRNTLLIAGLQAASASAPVYAYMFDRDSPVEGGRIRSPHTCELPFIFGTTAAAEAQIGKGSDIEPMTAMMMATWASFARSGNPNNASLPNWKPYSDADRHVMVLNAQSRLETDPGGRARAALASLPYFGYHYSMNNFLVD